MPDDDDAPPSAFDVVCECDYAVGAGVYGVMEISVSASDAVPVFPEVDGSFESDASCFVVFFCVRFADWEIESVSECDANLLCA